MHSNTTISHGTPNSEIRLIATDSFHIELSSAISRPAVTPQTRQIAFSHFPTMPFNSSIPSINMLLPRDTIKRDQRAAHAHRRRLPQFHPPGHIAERHQSRPDPRINRPKRIARRMRNAGLKRPRHQLPGILQRHLRRQRQVSKSSPPPQNKSAAPASQSAGTAAAPWPAGQGSGRRGGRDGPWRLVGGEFWATVAVHHSKTQVLPAAASVPPGPPWPRPPPSPSFPLPANKLATCSARSGSARRPCWATHQRAGQSPRKSGRSKSSKQ